MFQLVPSAMRLVIYANSLISTSIVITKILLALSTRTPRKCLAVSQRIVMVRLN